MMRPLAIAANIAALAWILFAVTTLSPREIEVGLLVLGMGVLAALNLWAAWRSTLKIPTANPDSQTAMKLKYIYRPKPDDGDGETTVLERAGRVTYWVGVAYLMFAVFATPFLELDLFELERGYWEFEDDWLPNVFLGLLGFAAGRALTFILTNR